MTENAPDPQLDELESTGTAEALANPQEGGGLPPEPTTAPPVETAKPIVAEAEQMFAVYNETLLRFVGPTYTDEKAANAAKRQLTKGTAQRFTVRPV